MRVRNKNFLRVPLPTMGGAVIYCLWRNMKSSCGSEGMVRVSWLGYQVCSCVCRGKDASTNCLTIMPLWVIDNWKLCSCFFFLAISYNKPCSFEWMSEKNLAICWSVIFTIMFLESDLSIIHTRWDRARAYRFWVISDYPPRSAPSVVSPV